MSSDRPAPTPRPLPAVLPLLDAGRHRSPEDGSCLMEYVSVISAGGFTDHPRCTHRVLARLARLVNDGVSDVARPGLALLAPDLVHGRARPHLVRPVVLAHVAAAGLSVAPRDGWFARLERTVRRYRSGTTRWPSRAWRRSTMAADTTFALGHLAHLLSAVEPAERDARLVRLLTDAVREVRALTGAPRADVRTPVREEAP